MIVLKDVVVCFENEANLNNGIKNNLYFYANEKNLISFSICISFFRI